SMHKLSKLNPTDADGYRKMQEMEAQIEDMIKRHQEMLVRIHNYPPVEPPDDDCNMEGRYGIRDQ
ncbi:MAG: hypothetical protein M0Z55_11920, partial [Peptococcaceae bacterium]|nr:hypothetical protein [Peptococcaceae bacterium]